jgi:hypothetical protein
LLLVLQCKKLSQLSPVVTLLLTKELWPVLYKRHQQSVDFYKSSVDTSRLQPAFQQQSRNAYGQSMWASKKLKQEIALLVIKRELSRRKFPQRSDISGVHAYYARLHAFALFSAVFVASL